MEDDGYWKDVEKAYLDSVREKVDLPDDELWEFAKRRARDRYTMQYWLDKARREGKNYEDVLGEEIEQRRQRQEQKIN